MTNVVEASQPCARSCGQSVGDRYTTIVRRGKADVVICARCALKERIDQYERTKEITTSLLMDATLDDAMLHSKGSLSDKEARVPSMVRDDIMRTMEACDQLIGEFRRRHWMGGLCKQIYDARHGLSGEAGGMKVLAMASAGRVLITIKDAKPRGRGTFGGALITLIGADGDITSRLGVQGLCATKEEAIALLWHAVYEMPKMRMDKKVGLGL